MKIVTAQELRATTRPVEDAVDAAIMAINKRVRERHGMGRKDALIGLTGETAGFSKLSESDRESIAKHLRVAGYHVTNGPAPKTIKLRWDKEAPDYEEEED